QDPAAAAERVAEDGLGERVEPRLHENRIRLLETRHDDVRRRQQIELDRERDDDRLPQDEAQHEHESRRRVFANAAHGLERSAQMMWAAVGAAGILAPAW